MMQTKQQQRQLLLERRKLVVDKEIKSRFICEEVYQLVKDASLVMSYQPTQEEVDISFLNRQLSKVCYPKCMNASQMESYLSNEFSVSHYGILEPVNGILVDPEEIDVVIVPLVGFDLENHRLGHGNGYYDHYLKRCHKAKFIGVAFKEQMLDHIVTDEHDICMHTIIYK